LDQEIALALTDIGRQPFELESQIGASAQLEINRAAQSFKSRGRLRTDNRLGNKAAEGLGESRQFRGFQAVAFVQAHAAQ
jgi:hypothetical protein